MPCRTRGLFGTMLWSPFQAFSPTYLSTIAWAIERLSPIGRLPLEGTQASVSMSLSVMRTTDEQLPTTISTIFLGEARAEQNQLKKLVG